MPVTPTPTPEAHLTHHRQNIARIVSCLRPVRPHTPFHRLAAHRVPTLWTLYRGLLRASPNPIVRSHVQALFRKHRHLTSPAITKVQLEKGHRWLDAFRKAKQGDERQRSVLQRFGRLISARRDHNKMRSMVNDALAWQHRLLNRPIFTPSLIRPTIYNAPLPRLKPQPAHITGMLLKRRAVRERRVELQRTLFAHLDDLQAEADFESNLAAAATTEEAHGGGGRPIPRYFSGPHLDAWRAPIASHLDRLQAAFDLDTSRAARPPSPELLRQLKAARREKVENKTRERAREARGEVLEVTRRRARLGFPAHVLVRWTPEERKANLLARRSVGEVGYVGQVKRALGYGVRPEEDQVDDATRERLDRLAEEVRRSNQTRRDREERIAS